MNEFISSYYGELYHHGVKGQKWGVRRYQNSDGSLTLEGKKRYYNKDGSLNPKGVGKSVKLTYKSAGSTTYLARRHSYDAKVDARDVEKINKAITKLQNNKYTDKQVKRLAKDYETAINGVKTLMARDSLKNIVDTDKIGMNERTIDRLHKKKNQSDRVKKKIDALVDDNILMELRILENMDKASKYKPLVDNLVKAMSEDKRVLYRTTRSSVAGLAGIENTSYTSYGTKYNVKSNTASRAKSKRYTDPINKRDYEDSIVKTTYYYY